MPISFNQFPSNWRLPLYWVEVDSSMAGLPLIRLPALLVGQKTADGVSDYDTPVPIGSLTQATTQFGAGSMLESMFRAYLHNNVSQEMWGLAVTEPVGQAAAGTIKVDQTTANPGVISLYIAGQLVRVAVRYNDTPAMIATNIVDTINAMPSLPCTAVVNGTATDTVDLTCNWIGATGNDIDMRDSYLTAVGGQSLPPGLTLMYGTAPGSAFSGKFTGGAGIPDFTAAIARLADEAYEYVAIPYTDEQTILDWDSEFGFTDTGRWGWMRQQYGHIFSAMRDTYANLLTFGSSQNSPVWSALGVEPESPTPVWEWTASYTAKASRALVDDPARPLQTLSFQKVLSAPKHMRLSLTELQDLTGAGIATQRVSSDNITPMILRETTFYQRNLYGMSDDAYELVTTLATLAKIIRNQKYVVTSKFPRHKLADDGTRFGVGQAIVTPRIVRGELIAQYAIDEFNGLVENATAFKNNLVVERDPNDPNRLNVLWPPDLINQLRVFAVLAQFRLQYDRGVNFGLT